MIDHKKPDPENNNNTARISFPEPGAMTPAQEAVYNDIVSGPRGTLVGPLRAALHNPILADRWQRFGQVLRFETTIPTRLNELAILVTARRWSSELEWAIHARDADRAGLNALIIEAIRNCELPSFESDEAACEIYEFARQLVQTGDVETTLYNAIVTRWNEVGAVELTAAIGYYSMVAMTLNVHRVPLPNGMETTLPKSGGSLVDLPAATPTLADDSTV